MKKCPWCGAEYSDDPVRCPIDGNPLESSASPVVSPPTLQSSVFRNIALLSLIAPLTAIALAAIVLAAAISFRSAMWMEMVGPLLILLGLLILGIGFILGVISLAATYWHGREGIFRKALAGAILNGGILLLVLSTVVVLMLQNHRIDPAVYQAAVERHSNLVARLMGPAVSEEDRFYALGQAAKASFSEGDIEAARHEASELLKLAPGFHENWNYGNAIQDGNLVLGRIALQEGRLEEAKERLLASGKTPGSPQLNSFGPNMSLARDLLEKGERKTVLEYFELCRSFWKMDFGKLKDWSEQVQLGQIPDFGANLNY